MNRFAISHLLALLCISFAPARAGRKELCQIKEARILCSIDGSSQMFDNGDVHLYEIIDDESPSEKSYQVKDNSGEFSHEFEIALDNTIATEDGITIKSYLLTIYISALNGDNIAFYQDIISPEEFDHEFLVTRVVRGGKTLENVFAVKAKEDEYGEWMLAAVDSNAARLIFPCSYVNWTQEYEDGDKGVSYVIEHKPQWKKITVEFDEWTVAKTFYEFVDSRRKFTRINHYI